MIGRTMRNATRFRLGLLATLAPLLGCASTIDSTDAAVADQGPPVDQGAPLDRGAPLDQGAPVDRGAPLDQGAPVDRGTPVDLGAPVDAGTAVDRPDVVDAPEVDAGPLCPSGRRERECLTLAQVEARIRNPPGEFRPVLDAGARDAGPEPLDVPLAGNGCYAPSYVQNGCCNRAYDVEREGDQCCYVFCAGACCGRPLLVDGVARAAAMVPASPWSEGGAGAPADGLDPATRAALARAWRDDGRMEHASVASFARFTLALMAMGAPPELLEEAQRAALDEVGHARACLALAARLDGAHDGPGALDVTGALDGIDDERIVRDAVVEGCVGETVSALIAQAQLRGATEPAARAALARIADDEERHAGLAWRFVAWALAARPRLREVAAAAFADATSRWSLSAPPPAPVVDAAAWRAWGRLDATGHAAAVREALAEVVGPCARALLAGESRGTTARGDDALA